MNNTQYVTLANCEQSMFREIAESFGFSVAGPSIGKLGQDGSWLIRDDKSKAWLFSPKRPVFGRHVYESVWTDFNVSIMNDGRVD